eukprot:SAG31_NODE_38170_length_298_cov_1.005025_1_plen_56_part_10
MRFEKNTLCSQTSRGVFLKKYSRRAVPYAWLLADTIGHAHTDGTGRAARGRSAHAR